MEKQKMMNLSLLAKNDEECRYRYFLSMYHIQKKGFRKIITPFNCEVHTTRKICSISDVSLIEGKLEDRDKLYKIKESYKIINYKLIGEKSTYTRQAINDEYLRIILVDVNVCEENNYGREIELPIYVLPRKGEILQYNGIRYTIEEIVHHYKEGFAPYIELIAKSND